ncbi:hypothetical protein [Leptospira interrogans]|uniref:hypothetical protein n=1 Tax=Leptospira interrogans TaxID=173 RepID=UPI0018828CAB|nr:hypothetical protein [Leptospira interrogans]MBE8421525.1 hypothetical protein [Leptospira interrogans serovar Pomona]
MNQTKKIQKNKKKPLKKKIFPVQLLPSPTNAFAEKITQQKANPSNKEERFKNKKIRQKKQFVWNYKIIDKKTPPT